MLAYKTGKMLLWGFRHNWRKLSWGLRYDKCYKSTPKTQEKEADACSHAPPRTNTE